MVPRQLLRVEAPAVADTASYLFELGCTRSCARWPASIPAVAAPAEVSQPAPVIQSRPVCWTEKVPPHRDPPLPEYRAPGGGTHRIQAGRSPASAPIVLLPWPWRHSSDRG